MSMTTAVEIRHRAKYLLPGSFLSEDESRELSDRSPDAAMTRAPERAFAFILYDVAVPTFEYDEALFTVVPKVLNKSGRYYIGGETFTPDDLRALAVEEGDPDKYRILIANAEGNGWPRMIRCRTGNWQPFENGDVLLSAPERKEQ